MGYSEQATATPRRRRGDARTYDFRRPVRLAREHAHLLRVAMATFGRQSTTVLTTGLRTVCLMSSPELEELSYDEYLSGMPEQAVCLVLSLEPLQGRALFTLDQRTLLAMIDHLLGGPGTEEQPDRPLSDIEQALVEHLMKRILRELAYALEPIAATTPKMVGLESNAQFVQAAAATDPVVVARLDLTIGTRETWAALCLPYAMFAPALEELNRNDDQTERARQRQAATIQTGRRLTDVEVDVAVRFDPLTMSSSQIGRLAVGDVVSLGHRTSMPLSVTAASTSFARAIPGTSGRRQAVLIVTSS